MKIKKQFLVTIEVDSEAIIYKYPNYKYNFKSIEDFIDFIANDVQWVGNINMSRDGMEEYGYSVKIKQITKTT